MNVEAFKLLLRDRCGLEFNGIAEKPLRDAIGQRCGCSGATAEAYLARIAQDAREFNELVSLLTINETYFFREPSQIDLFVKVLVPRLLTKRTSGQVLHILSAGCSSGEEPYSLAMALLESYGELAAERFVIIAGDIDQLALEKARSACYREYSLRSVSPDIRSRYFVPSGEADCWRVSEILRRMVRIEHLNLFDQPLLPGSPRFDAIFFRNVSIYFGLDKRREIQERFRGQLQPDGILMIGIAETLANDLGVFSLVEEQGLFYFSPDPQPAKDRQPAKAEQPGQSRLSIAPTSLEPRWPEPPAPVAHPTPGADLAGLLSLIREKHLDEAISQLESQLTAATTQRELLLLLAFCRLQKKDYQAAAGLARQVLGMVDWSIDACVILGLAARQQGGLEEAIAWFKQAVYDRHECWPAHYYLAELYRASAAPTKARRAYRTTLQLMGSSGIPASGLQLIPLDLPVSEVRFLCQHQLGKMPAEGC